MADQQSDQDPTSGPSPSTGNVQNDGPSDSGPRIPSTPNLLIILLLVLIGAYLFRWISSPLSQGNNVDYSFFRSQVEADNVASVRFRGELLSGTWRTAPPNPDPDEGEMDEAFNTVLPPTLAEDRSLYPLLNDHGVKVDADPLTEDFGMQFVVWFFLPLLLVGFLFFVMMRRSADPLSGGMMGSFIRSPARRFQADEQHTTFRDVAAMEQAKNELEEVVDFLRSPTRYQKLGAQIPKGVLLMGSPGTGKTLLARATAGEAGVPFYSINGSEFIQMFVGVGASRVRDLFRNAKENAPCILFIDEIDAVGRVRGAGLGGGHDEREQTLNQILSEMDGFQQTETVIVVAATNRPDVLDPALMRPGRFDRHIVVERPNRKGRVAILNVHTRCVPLSDSVDLDKVGGSAVGFSGADLRNLVNEAALHAARENKKSVDMDDFEYSHDRVIMGAEREDILNNDERKMTAYHEAGHALLAWHLPELDSVHKVTIIPRGRALGVTQLLPDEDRYNIGETRLRSQIVMIMGGRAAEKLVFGEYSAGAEDDLNKATQTARRMVAHWGMSEVVGPVSFRQHDDHPFLGKEIHEQREFSEETAHMIDQEVQSLLNASAQRADELLRQHRSQLDQIASALLEEESIDREDMERLLR